MTDTQNQQSQTYDESAFDVLEGLEPVRQVPGMYTRTKNPLHITQEVVDNAFDEAQNKHGDRVSVTLHKDGSVSVSDNGRGIPVGLHPKQGIPVVVLAFTKLHAGAKFRKGNTYARSGGLHGVGVSVTNALSTKLQVEVKRDGKVHRVHFIDGDREISPVEQVGECGPRTNGTTVRFWPNAKYFESGNIPVGELEHLLRSKAMLLPGVTVKFTNEADGSEQVWCYKEGMQAYLQERLEGKELVGEVFTGSGHLAADGEGTVAGDGASWSVAWTTDSGKGESYVNLIPTPLGGTHEAGLRSGLFEAMKSYCELHGLLPRNITLQAEDVWSGAQFVLAANITHTQFQGQTKDKLTSREVVRVIASVVKDPFMAWLMRTPESAKKIAELVIKQAQARQKEGKTVEKKKSSGIATLPGKLTDCTSTNIAYTEIFLVEGDSAGGGCKTARNREFQAVLPLRGKVQNTEEVPRTLLFANTEVHDISVAIGVDPHDADAPDSVLANLRYGKINILSDADVDGSHIQVLLLTLFYRHFPKLIEKGHVCIVKPPLFKIEAPARGKSKPAQKIYCLTEQERDAKVAQLMAEGLRYEQLTISRFKGLGEMMPEQLADTVLDPDTRLLLTVKVSDAVAANELMRQLMAKSEAAARRTLLEERGYLAEVDV